MNNKIFYTHTELSLFSNDIFTYGLLQSQNNIKSSPMIHCGIKTSNEDILTVSRGLCEYVSLPESTEVCVSGLLICCAGVQ